MDGTRLSPSWSCGARRCSAGSVASPCRSVCSRASTSASVDTQRGGALRGCCQHGDFSLNNLLVSPESIAIIGFDEFGRTRDPLHDVFGLALSVRVSQGDRCRLTARECIAQCVTAVADR